MINELQEIIPPFLLSFKLAAVTVILLLIIGTPLAWWLRETKSRFKPVIEALIALPLVLPSTVIGFYLLIILSKGGLAFTFSGIVIGSMIYTLPFIVQPLQNSFENINNSYIEAATTLGAKPLDRFFSVIVPMSKDGFLTATVLGMAHTIGEFGIILMIGGNIPGKTRVISIAIFEHVEAIEYGHANLIAGILMVISFITLLIVYTRKNMKRVTSL